MSSLNQEHSPKHNKENILVAKQQLDTIGHESDSDNGNFDNNITFNQSDHSSSVTPSVHEHSGSNDHSDASDESDEEILKQNKGHILYRNMILYFGREVVVFLILLLTTFATYHNM